MLFSPFYLCFSTSAEQMCLLCVNWKNASPNPPWSSLKWAYAHMLLNTQIQVRYLNKCKRVEWRREIRLFKSLGTILQPPQIISKLFYCDRARKWLNKWMGNDHISFFCLRITLYKCKFNKVKFNFFSCFYSLLYGVCFLLLPLSVGPQNPLFLYWNFRSGHI